MTTLAIVANIIAKADQIDLIKAELLKLIDITLAEAGCINYDLHQDIQNPAHFVFYEIAGKRMSFGRNTWTENPCKTSWPTLKVRLLCSPLTR